ncbi:MAG: S26 family signal peptidase [Paludibacter sp.]|nr:S26 family signal peptidase [Paludibacter sp.]
MNSENQTSRFQHPVKQWIKAVVWSLIYILFIAWVGNYWWLLGLPVVFDAFITHYIPWTWWKKTKNKALLGLMGWVDAILFALIAVYFINTFLFQNYQIPSSSLEKSLLVGDFLFVSKASYGPRIPNTPLSFPLVQHTFPMLNCKSYIEHPQWDYHRLKGFDTVKHDDIVVFNFPTGDTVALKVTNPDYYTSCYQLGRDVVNSRKDIFGDIVYRPVDRRENFVKRCVGLPGDWLQIKDNQVYVNGKAQKKIPGLQFNYYVQTDGTRLSADLLDKLNISVDDRALITDPQPDQQSTDQAHYEIVDSGFDPKFPIYHFPLTEDSYNKIQKVAGVTKIKIEQSNSFDVFPLGGHKRWTRDNYGPIWIPKKGTSLILNAYNLPIYERIIRVYEHNKFEVKGNEYFINDKPAKTYTFKMDYYWMMGDNRHNSADSRYWGFVPEDHIVGRPVLVWLSLDKDKGWFSGKIRWNRFFKNAER